MTAPGGGFGDSAHDDKADLPPVGHGASEPSEGPAAPTAPWQPPAGDHPPPAYPWPGYPPEHESGYPTPYPPSAPPHPGYEPPVGYEQQPPVYGATPYPSPPPLGGPPPSYGPPGYPGGYFPPPDYRGGYAFPGPQGPQAGTNPLAIASLVAAFTGLLCCIGSVVAMVLGAIALDQIKRTRQEGFGLAVAGIVIGVASLVVTLVVVLFALHTH
jgi:Domain of unknown function (DUF4190)